MAALLIEKGASIEAVNNNGRAALRVAQRNGRNAVVALLLRKGALVSLLSSEICGASGLDYTVHTSPEILASHANTIVPLLQSRVAGVRVAALNVLDTLNLADVSARSKMIARLLTHLGRSFPGIRPPPLLRPADAALAHRGGRRAPQRHGFRCTRRRSELHSAALQPEQRGRRDAAHGIELNGGFLNSTPRPLPQPLQLRVRLALRQLARQHRPQLRHAAEVAQRSTERAVDHSPRHQHVDHVLVPVDVLERVGVGRPAVGRAAAARRRASTTARQRTRARAGTSSKMP